MTFQVILQRLAIVDLQEYYDFTAARSVIDASRWLDPFHAALQTLNERPDRCPLALKNARIDVELREFHSASCHTYFALFSRSMRMRFES